jgi:D-xylose transport system substrate-binding protein
VLKPLYANGTFKKGPDQFVPQWNNQTAGTIFDQMLVKTGNKIDAAAVANDGMAGGVVSALQKQHLNGKIPVTGQDATVAGIQQILLGNQSMTVYKPIRTLSKVAAHIVDLWLHHRVYHSKVKTDTLGAGKTPSVIKPVETVTKSNIKSTVIKDGFVTKAELCTSAVPAADCAGL